MRNERHWSAGQIALAGVAGGSAEVLWIALVSVVLGVESWQISRSVTSTVFPSLSEVTLAPWIGLAIHFALSFALAAMFAYTVGRRLRGPSLFLAAIVVLGLVWAFNFLVLLPALNPAFTTLLPHPVTLVSKLLFGAAMAGTLALRTARPTPRVTA